jgi:hypothetical protein
VSPKGIYELLIIVNARIRQPMTWSDLIRAHKEFAPGVGVGGIVAAQPLPGAAVDQGGSAFQSFQVGAMRVSKDDHTRAFGSSYPGGDSPHRSLDLLDLRPGDLDRRLVGRRHGPGKYARGADRWHE